MDIKKQH